MDSMDSMSHLLFNQVEQIADVKTCNVDNNRNITKFNGKCTWEPATILERFCGKIIDDYNKDPKHVENLKHDDGMTENNISINIVEKSVIDIEKSETELFEDSPHLIFPSNNLNDVQLQNVNTEMFKEHSQIMSNLFNKEPSEIYATNTEGLNENLPPNNYSSSNNLTQHKFDSVTQHKFDSVNNITFNNFTIKPDPDQEVFPNINILCESNNNTFNHEEESNTTSKDQNNGLTSTLESTDILTRPFNKFKSNISNNTAAARNVRCNRTNQLPEKCFKCHLCLFSTAHNCNLVRHMRKHTGEKPFKCSKCSFSTSRKCSLKTHMLIHTGEKPFKCSECSYSTSRKNSLKTHMLQHIGDYPLKCHLCSYSTTRKESLNYHLLTEHTDQALPNPTSDEDRSSTTVKIQNNGLSSPHNMANSITETCNDLTSNKNIIATGNLIVATSNLLSKKCFKCQLCSFSTPHNSVLKRHILTHTKEKPFKCSECSFYTSRKSSIKRHMPQHTGDYPFKCHLCSYSASRNGYLKYHLHTKHRDQALF